MKNVFRRLSFGCLYLIIGSFVLMALGVTLHYVVYDYGTRPKATQIDGVPIKSWLENAVTLKGNERQEAVEQIAGLMVEATKHPRWRSSLGLLSPSDVAENNQQLEDVESFRIYSDEIANLISKSAQSELVESRRASISAASILFHIANFEQKGVFEIIVTACDDSDSEVAKQARRSLLFILDRNQEAWSSLEEGKIAEIVKKAVDDGFVVPEEVREKVDQWAVQRK